MCSCQIHRRFVLQSWAVVISPTFAFAPSYTVSVSGSLRKPLRSLASLSNVVCRRTTPSVQSGLQGTGFRLREKPLENRDAYARYRRNYSKLTRFENCCNVPLPSHRFETLSGCSHKEMWAGCRVFLTTPTRSSLSALRSVSLRSLAEKASRVLAASYFLR